MKRRDVVTAGASALAGTAVLGLFVQESTSSEPAGDVAAHNGGGALERQRFDAASEGQAVTGEQSIEQLEAQARESPDSLTEEEAQRLLAEHTHDGLCPACMALTTQGRGGL